MGSGRREGRVWGAGGGKGGCEEWEERGEGVRSGRREGRYVPSIIRCILT